MSYLYHHCVQWPVQDGGIAVVHGTTCLKKEITSHAAYTEFVSEVGRSLNRAAGSIVVTSLTLISSNAELNEGTNVSDGLTHTFATS